MNLRRSLWQILAIAINGLLLIEVLIGSPCQAQSEKIVIARIDNEIEITKDQLELVMKQYQERVRRPFTTKEERLQLIQNLISRQLILRQDAMEVYRNDPEIKRRMRAYENSLIITEYIREHIGRRLNPTEEELTEYYKKNRTMFVAPPKVEARHILLRTRQDAAQVMQKLQRGDDFIKLAKDYSIDLPLAGEGGQMAKGPIAKGEAVAELDEVLFVLGEGEISDIVETKYGYHIVRVEKIIPPEAKPFEEVKDQIRTTLMRERENKAYNEMTARLKKDVVIEIFEDRIH
jgi:peptidyl-prolyl cis-trans isomerase C